MKIFKKNRYLLLDTSFNKKNKDNWLEFRICGIGIDIIYNKETKKLNQCYKFNQFSIWKIKRGQYQ